MLLIEKARESDLDFVKQLETESGLSVWTRKDYLAEINRPDSIFLIVKEEGKNLGFLLARLIIQLPKKLNNFDSTLLDKNLSEIDIYNIAVERQSRRKSIGTALLDTLAQIGTHKNACKINLEVRESNTNALNFYKKNHFKVVGTRKNFYSNPTEDAILMTRTIAQYKIV